MNEIIQKAFQRLVDSYTLTNPPRCTGCKHPQPMTLVNPTLSGSSAIFKFKCFPCGDLLELTVNFNPDGTYNMKWNQSPQFSV